MAESQADSPRSPRQGSIPPPQMPSPLSHADAPKTFFFFNFKGILFILF